MTEATPQDQVILVADVTASVELYERIGDAAAYQRIAGALDRLRASTESAGGEFIQSRGDDVLCVFPSPDAAADAALHMDKDATAADVTLHVAIHRGETIVARETIFGDAVNVTYRLASIANAGEILISGEAMAGLSGTHRGRLRSLRSFRFKGRAAPVEVFAIDTDTAVGASATELPAHLAAQMQEASLVLRLSHEGRSWEISEAESLSIGRADGVDVKIDRPWVSRRHAVFFVREGGASLTDRSTYGTFVDPNGGTELKVRRQTVPLSGAGTISLGMTTGSAEAEPIAYVVMRASDARG